MEGGRDRKREIGTSYADKPARNRFQEGFFPIYITKLIFHKKQKIKFLGLGQSSSLAYGRHKAETQAKKAAQWENHLAGTKSWV